MINFETPIEIGESIATQIAGHTYTVRRIENSEFVWSVVSNNGNAMVGSSGTYHESVAAALWAKESLVK
jgi:hypothetical protein